ncbi:hypothetical protein F9222_25535, partial [Escherichia coli]
MASPNQDTARYQKQEKAAKDALNERGISVSTPFPPVPACFPVLFPCKLRKSSVFYQEFHFLTVNNVESIVHFYKVRDDMKKASDRILKRSVLSVLVAVTLYTPQAMAEFTKIVNSGTVEDQTVDNGGTQTVVNEGKTKNITVDNGGTQVVYNRGSVDGTKVKNGGVLNVDWYGNADNAVIDTGGKIIIDDDHSNVINIHLADGANLTVSMSKNITVNGENTRGNFSIKNGQAENVLLENGGLLKVNSNTEARSTVINNAGKQMVYSGGKTVGTIINNGGIEFLVGSTATSKNTVIYQGGSQIVQGKATGTTIYKGGLMQNAGGEDSSTTVKDDGVYELGRKATDSPGYPYQYAGTARASDLTVEAGGRATVYAGTLTGATVSGANASLTLMTPQTKTADGDLTLSL